VFDYEDLCLLKIPLPPIEVQQSIVNLYNCLEEAKKIASEAREKLKILCPALVQKAANS
jgi:type I restriction enzyme S subunit